ncbi:MAG TPA: hypothetical protein VFB52_14705, partial [Solirubrobacterales bacterium]|nr:hypothetical protein [Solirubrobacterales bacterium]
GCTPPLVGFQVVAIDAAAGDAWLLGQGATLGEGLELFHRETGGGSPVWRQVPLGPPNTLGARYGQAEADGIQIAARSQGQPLTASASGVWIDATLDGAEDATVYFDAGKGEVTGAWCDLGSVALCPLPLGGELPSGQGRSFAWPADSANPFGTRSVTGVGQGAILTFAGSSFRRLTFVGGTAGASQGAALSAPDEGWLGATPPLQLTRNPAAARLQSWPVPFRRPLTALATAPGSTPGALDSEALAVGAEGQVARYVPGIGWEPEFLLRASGKRATPRLRAVAWPEEERAYAVGDNGNFWRWQKKTGLWQPDPGAPANMTRGNMTGVAFDPAKPSRGYAIGQQGVLLGYGREWKQEALPPGVPAEANLTSIAFAGSEALVTWKFPENPNNSGTPRYFGGVIVNDGFGWRTEPLAEAALTESEGRAVPQRVAGLPDGGAVIATLGFGESTPPVEGRVIERQGPGAAWQVAPGGAVGYPAALAAIREGGQVRAIVSVTPKAGVSQGSAEMTIDQEQIFNQPPAGQAPLLTDPYPLPATGVVMRQTPGGWRDEQQQNYPLPQSNLGQSLYDLPLRPDPVLALLITADGSGGWAVGGETGSATKYRRGEIVTAGVMRYGSGAAPPSNTTAAPISAPSGVATFALGAHAQCVAQCADYGGAGLGPDRWLRAAVSRAASVPGMRAFLYAGNSVAPTQGAPQSEQTLAQVIGAGAYAREQAAYASRLGNGGGALPVFAAPSASDLDASGSLATFYSAFAGFGAPFGTSSARPGIAPVSQGNSAQPYYAFDSTGAGGAVRVVVLDYSRPELGDGQRCWLAQQLSGAAAVGRPAIVVGGRDLAGLAPDAAADRTQVIQTLVGVGAPAGCGVGAASAYLFDFPEENRAYRLSAGGRSIPAYGSGTLGYVTPPAPTDTDFAGASGFLTVSVDVANRDKDTNVAPVAVQLVPSIGSLALDATDGTLLRRSQPALFEGLARRPLAGSKCEGDAAAPAVCDFQSPPPYVPVPSDCLGTNCATSVFPEYTFSSSRPDIADFVSADPGSTNPRNVLLVKGKPVLDPHSGLLCAFNAGTTLVSITTGGLAYTQKVTVQAGTVQRPCGTTPLKKEEGDAEDPGEPQAPKPEVPVELPIETVPPPPPPPAPQVQPSPPPAAQPIPPTPTAPIAYVPIPISPAVPLVPIVPPPPLPAVQPTPPSGTSQVNAVEEEEEPEEATESSSAFAALPEPGPANVSLRRRDSDGGVPLLIPALVLVAAVAAAGIGGRRRRDPRPAFQTNNNRRYR